MLVLFDREIPLFRYICAILFRGHGPKVFGGLVLLVAASLMCPGSEHRLRDSVRSLPNLAKRGVLSKGSTFISQSRISMPLPSTKPGPARGKPEVTILFADSVNEEQVIDIVVALEKGANHLANTILEKFGSQNQPRHQKFD